MPISHVKVDRKSRYYHAAVACGWRFSNGVILKINESISLVVFYFTCVCGTKEHATMAFDKSLKDIPKRLDICKLLGHSGAFSVNHLKQDGYKENFIDSITNTFKKYGVIN